MSRRAGAHGSERERRPPPVHAPGLVVEAEPSEQLLHESRRHGVQRHEGRDRLRVHHLEGRAINATRA